MLSVKEAATAFLANKRIAVTGVSRKPQGHGSNVVYKMFDPATDFGHKVMRFVFTRSGKVPKKV